jgi:RNA polymerase sigma-70 factor (ECF subfamily)
MTTTWLRRFDRVDRRQAVREERALVERMLAGDEAAFERFVEDYTPVLYRFASRKLGDREMTRDIVQTTLCKAIAKLGGFRGESGLATWLCACCRNEIADLYRRRGRAGTEVELTDEALERRLPSTGASAASAEATDGPERELIEREDGALVHAALDALPPRYGRALEWKYLDRLSVEEIGRRLELGPKAAESLLSRARASFRAGYERLVAESGGGGRLAGRVPPVASVGS